MLGNSLRHFQRIAYVRKRDQYIWNGSNIVTLFSALKITITSHVWNWICCKLTSLCSISTGIICNFPSSYRWNIWCELQFFMIFCHISSSIQFRKNFLQMMRYIVRGTDIIHLNLVILYPNNDQKLLLVSSH